MMGTERRSLVMSEAEKRMTAYHEGGHALCAMHEPECDPVHKATIIPRGRALGLVMSLPEGDRYSKSKSKLLAELTMAMGGRAAEETIFGPDKVSNGAAGDIKIANTAQDRFYNTDLDKALKAKGVTTLIIAGWKVSGSVTYTSVGAMVRDFTVVVPVDATAAASDYETTIGFYNILNSGNANLANEPLKAKASTLSRTDTITFK